MFYAKGSQPCEIREAFRGGDGSATLTPVMPAGALPAKCRLASVITLEKGSTVGYHTHEGETEIYYVLSGTASFSDDGEAKTGVPGDVLVTPSGHGHGVANTGDEPLRMLAVIVLD